MIHINRFVDKIRMAESKGNGAPFPMTVMEAKNLRDDITKLLLHLQQQQESKPIDETITIEVSGEDF